MRGVENWQSRTGAIAHIAVVWTVTSLGAAPGDIRPGESSGDGIEEDLSAWGDLLGAFVR